MHIFYSPDATKYPEEIHQMGARPSLGLEQLTGADLALTKLPIPITPDNLNGHIERWTLFVQVKIGYDILSFDALHNFCARAQAARIPKSQAILLPIGDYHQDNKGMLRVNNQKAYGNTTWEDFERVLMSCEIRGVTVWPLTLKSPEELSRWITSYFSMVHKAETTPQKKVYPPRVEPVFVIDDIWQLVEEVSPDTIDYFLCAGLKGFGQKTLQAVREYMQNELPHIAPDQPDQPLAGYYVIKVLTDMRQGKLVHNVPGWGPKRAANLRQILMIPDNLNLTVNGHVTDQPYKVGFQQGWKQGLITFKDFVEKQKIRPQAAHKKAFEAGEKMAAELIEF